MSWISPNRLSKQPVKQGPRQCSHPLHRHLSHHLPLLSVDLAQLVEETLIGCWLGRAVGKPAAEVLPIGEIYAPQASLVALQERKRSIEPIIDIEPLSVSIFASSHPFFSDTLLELGRHA